MPKARAPSILSDPSLSVLPESAQGLAFVLSAASLDLIHPPAHLSPPALLHTDDPWQAVQALLEWAFTALRAAPQSLLDPARHRDAKPPSAADASALVRSLNANAGLYLLGALHQGSLDHQGKRRHTGAHYTSSALARELVARTLAPLLAASTTPDNILSLSICDPSMGVGAMLVEACVVLADHLERAWAQTGFHVHGSAHGGAHATLNARAAVATQCLYGIDQDPRAVELARLTLWLVVGSPDLPLDAFDQTLLLGDALTGSARDGDPALPDPPPDHAPFHFSARLPHVFAKGGFDAIVGNPPWVAYAGRAAQPLDPNLRAYYLKTSPAFAGYRTLQGVFVHRAATLLRPGGRLGLVLPTSMADLDGYEPTRRAHDAIAVCDDELLDFGDGAFEGVFQPSMGLVSTRRRDKVSLDRAGIWPLERSDLDADTKAFLDRLGALPRLPPELFGERGFQSMGGDVERFSPTPEGDRIVPVRTGSEVAPFSRKPAALYCDPRDFGGRFRPEGEWRRVEVLIRQTARYPLAALSDGGAFRNSVLAGLPAPPYDAGFLVGYLNASPIRFYHYMRHRDARQGMPQLKIGHLRALPAPDASAIGSIRELGLAFGERNQGISAVEQRSLDDRVAAALGVEGAMYAKILAWAEKVKG